MSRIIAFRLLAASLATLALATCLLAASNAVGQTLREERKALLVPGETWTTRFESGTFQLTLLRRGTGHAEAHIELRGPDGVTVVFFTQYLAANQSSFIYTFDARNPDGFWPAKSLTIRCVSGSVEISLLSM